MFEHVIMKNSVKAAVNIADHNQTFHLLPPVL